MKRLMFVLAAAVFALGMGSAVMASGGPGIAAPGAPVSTDVTFSEGLCGYPGAHCRWIGDANAFGSQLVFTLPLSDVGTRTKIGYEQGVCTNLHRKNGRVTKNYCNYNIHLRSGAVSVQGTLPFTDPFVGRIPVTGGTGEYEGASGYLRILKTFPRYRLHIVVGA